MKKRLIAPKVRVNTNHPLIQAENNINSGVKKRSVKSAISSPTPPIAKVQKTLLYMQNVISKLPGSIYWKDINGIYLGCNDFVLQMANMDQVVGKTDYDMPWKAFADQIRQVDEKVMRTNKSIELEEYPTLSNGEQIVMLTHKAPLKDEQGNTVGVIGVSVDITERKRLEAALLEAKEKAEAANKAKTEFLENMRHDIRTPLTGITGLASIMRDEANDSQTKENAEKLVTSGDALLELLNEILDVIKVNSGEIPLLKNKFNLKDRLAEVIKLNEARAQQKRIDLVIQYDEHIPHYLIGDSTRIHRIALELLNNALNFTKKGSVKLIAALAKASEEDVVIKLEVEDTGIGITSEQQEQIFVQFKRLTPSYEGIYKGVGLGLTLVKRLLDDIKGEIYVESKPKIGSKFTCLIPLTKPLLNDDFGCEKLAPSISSVTKSSTDIRPFKKTLSENPNREAVKNRVLVVEDDAIASFIIADALTKLNCEVDIAPKGDVGIQLAKTNDYDLIVMDIGLPDIDGYETTKRIRLNELAKGRNVPIIALTAHVDEENKQRCFDAGMNAVFSKPLPIKKTEEILDEFIPYRKQQQQDAAPVTSKEEKTAGKIEGNAIDKEAAIKFLNGDEKLFEKMLSLLDKNLKEDLIALHAGHKKNDWHSIGGIAHKLKGGCGYCGTLRLKEVCTRLESAVNKDQSQSFQALYEEFLHEIQLVQEALKLKKY